MFGNHDAFYLARKLAASAKKKKKKKKKGTESADEDGCCDAVAPGAHPRLGFTKEWTAVRQQHEALSASNVAWGRRDVAEHRSNQRASQRAHPAPR
jgi:hypothetical protein